MRYELCRKRNQLKDLTEVRLEGGAAGSDAQWNGGHVIDTRFLLTASEVAP